MRRLALVVCFGALLAVAVGVLYAIGRGAMAAEQRRLDAEARAGRVAVLEGIRDELDRAVQGLLQREDARPYYHYKAFYAPPDALAVQLALVPSPIGGAPDEPLVRAYFEYRDGRLSSPGLLEPAVEPLAAKAQSVAPPAGLPEALSQLARLRPRLAEQLGEPELDPVIEQQVDALICAANGNLDQTIEELSKAPRDQQSVDRLQQQWSAYQSRKGSYREPPKSPGDLVPVRLFPFRVLAEGRDADGWPQQLVAVRRVEVARLAWLQGFAFDLDHLRRMVLPSVIRDRCGFARSAGYVNSQAPGSGSLGSSWVLTSRVAAGDGLPVEVLPAASFPSQAEQVALRAPLEELILVFAASARASQSLSEGRLLLDGALFLALAVVGVGGVLLVLAARGQQRLARQRADFVAALSHELKAPLTGVRALTELLHEGLVTDPAKQQEYYATMLAECDRLARLVQNVLAAAKLERGRLPVVLEPVDPGPLLQELAGRFAPRLESAGFAFELELPDALPRVQGDREAFTQVLANLLENAAKYGKERIRLEAAADERALRVAVSDRGPGVPAAERERIFERFYRAEQVPREVGGAGLGLHIARAQARAQGGELRCAPNPAGGARFEFRLPLAGGPHSAAHSRFPLG